jgi:LacI family transcriptional regulator
VVAVDQSSHRKPTQGDVARLARVSQTAVSYVLSNKPAVNLSDETRQRILAAAQELGYVPNSAARALRTRKSMTIANIIPDITNPFYPWFERGIQDAIESEGYDLIVFNTDGLREKEQRALRFARQGRVDGLIMTPFHLSPADFSPLADSGIAAVVLGRTELDWSSSEIDNISIDNVAAARTAVDHLLDKGHLRVAMIAGIRGTPPRERRVEGYREALAAHNMPVVEQLIRAGEFTEAGGYEGAKELLRLSPRPTAIFAANDLMAIGALQALREEGIAVPGEIAIVGFDDISAASLVHPSLTTIAQFPYELGRRAADLLFDRLSGRRTGPGDHVEMPFELIVRESA